MIVKYNLPKKIIFCRNCVMSNQRPGSISEFFHTKDRKNANYLKINQQDGICDACKQNEIKNKINWKEREKKLIKLLAKHRKKNGEYDCLVPGSGGKDSAYQAHILKYKYKMNPLIVTWPPILYTDYGLNNYNNWINIGGFDALVVRPNGKVMKELTKLSITNLLHPFQTFILGQKNIAPKIASKFGINLVFYGENEAEYGNPIAENNSSLRKKSYFAVKNYNKIFLAGLKISDLIKKNKLKYSDLKIFLPISDKEINKKKIEIHYLGYYLKWIPQEAFYYAVKNTGFSPRPFRTQGTFSKYNSIDDKIDDLHYYTTFIKFGIGRATYDASQEIRNKHLTREEGKNLVKKYDGEFPDRYFSEIMKFLDLREETFFKICDKFRSPHLWKKEKNIWRLRHNVNNDGTDD
ncbi:N-acetyl sugar amidotransferase [Candidatus Pelagibacter sp. HIMB1321]|uniref:N-acetyl sugar amidotransferase n=2 Tax=Candidatus Pelagibacter sp. HIMB1321 TaxID=1388755 RepID=UPI000A07DD2D|nr:N-acetyl sugar amidotransferase [Candidatus Pelagibacter sp. HIMB1321]SMF79591.1 N-acetyl sugar amidotransferase [Candidatus Pelagibacter sp. HIMB1321]